MTAVDTNVLVYAHDKSAVLYQSAVKRLRALSEGPESWGIPLFCLGEFVRITTHPRIFLHPFSVNEACDALDQVFKSPTVHLLRPGTRFAALFSEALKEGKANGNLAFDAQIVALCREAGVRSLISEDRDFGRFSNFRTERI